MVGRRFISSKYEAAVLAEFGPKEKWESAMSAHLKEKWNKYKEKNPSTREAERSSTIKSNIWELSKFESLYAAEREIQIQQFFGCFF